jgi:hypothetical protein
MGLRNPDFFWPITWAHRRLTLDGDGIKKMVILLQEPCLSLALANFFGKVPRVPYSAKTPHRTKASTCTVQSVVLPILVKAAPIVMRRTPT